MIKKYQGKPGQGMSFSSLDLDPHYEATKELDSAPSGDRWTYGLLITASLMMILLGLLISHTAHAEEVILVCEDFDLVFGGNTTPRCASWIQIPASTAETDLTALTNILESMFSTPDPDQIVAAWMSGFSLPLITYLAAWALGLVVNQFSDRADYDPDN